MKLQDYALRDCLDSWSRNYGGQKYGVAAVRYWCGKHARLVAGINVDNPSAGVRFFIGGFAIATPYYWPDLDKLSPDLLNTVDESLQHVDAWNLRSVLNIFHKDTECL